MKSPPGQPTKVELAINVVMLRAVAGRLTAREIREERRLA